MLLLLPWVPLPDTIRVFVDNVAQYLLCTDVLCAPEGSIALDRVLTVVVVVASEVEVGVGGGGGGRLVVGGCVCVRDGVRWCRP